MKTTMMAGCAAALLLVGACGSLHTVGSSPTSASSASAEATEEAITALERACLEQPTNAGHWARLATALDAVGQRERATRFYRQAATLSAHDAQHDYALLRSVPVPAQPGMRNDLPRADARKLAAAAQGGAGERDGALARTQVQRLGAALVQVVRVPADGAPPAPVQLPTVTPAVAQPTAVRLEISNGNGVAGAAARLARTLAGEVDGLRAVRLTNARPFTVPATRIEYARAQQAMAQTLSQHLGVPAQVRGTSDGRADVRIVLGHDSAAGGHKKTVQ